MHSSNTNMEEQLSFFKKSHALFFGHVPNISKNIESLIDNHEHFKKLICQQHQSISISENLKETQKELLRIEGFPDEYYVNSIILNKVCV